ncbi:MAG: rhomboid family intramembrane serine protease [Proteobacteria bacterium]|nr:rhomboid family intramembrane serine protease [Pseudomonadota bacterium]
MIEDITTSINFIIYQTKINANVLLTIIAIPWVVFFINRLFFNNKLLYLGIIPRRLRGLLGIFFSPFLHADFNHLFFNSIPLFVLADFLLINGLPFFLEATIIIGIISGFLTWCFAKPGIHIGASGIITGYWGLLVADIVKQSSFTAIILGLLSLYYFAGIFLGIFPGKKGVSWEGHLFGLIGGLLANYLLFIN